MLHLRISVPGGVAGDVEAALRSDPRVFGLVILPGAAEHPAGDYLQCDVSREGADAVIAVLDRFGVTRQGTVTVSPLTSAVGPYAELAEAAAPGAPDDGVVWPLVEYEAWDGVQWSVAFFAMLTLATALAAIAVITDSAVLVVGAMVVAPDFAPIAGVAVGLALHRWRLVRRSLALLVVGFATAIAVTAVAALLLRELGWLDLAMLVAPRPQTGFVWHPDRWSVIVGVLAGSSGVVSMTSGRSNALVGVFISVTTVPAAGNLALGLAFREVPEISGSLLQLGYNIAGLIAGAAATLLLQKLVWRAVGTRIWGLRHRRRVEPPAG